MSSNSLRLTAVVLGITLLAVSGCSKRPKRLHPPGVSRTAASDAMQQYDTNGDGQIAGEELDKAPALKAAIEQLDTSGDDAVSADEIAARLKSWKDSKMGRMSLSCTVRRRGQPLQGVTVTFEPEKFLGSETLPATGQTDQYGMAMLSIPTTGPNDPAGVAPGFYLVRITASGADIPANYNTETIFGQEVAADAANINEGITFDLD